MSEIRIEIAANEAVPLHNYYRETHLLLVIEKMRVLGSPTLKAAYFNNRWYLREGTHRQRAASKLNLTLLLKPEPWNKSKKASEQAIKRKTLKEIIF